MKLQTFGFMQLWKNSPLWRIITASAIISSICVVFFWPSNSAGYGTLGELFSLKQETPVELYNRGVLYFKGEGVIKDKAEAASLYHKAAEQGLDQAQFSLATMNDYGDGIPESKPEAVYWYCKAAEQGNIPAQLRLFKLYYTGEGIPENKAEAARWLRKAAELGNTDAQSNLGAMYFMGEGVPKDEAEAIRWTRKAAGLQ